jgi:hypothetical protein
MSEQVSFYKTLYSKVPTDSAAQDRLLNLLERKLTDEQRDSCEDLCTTSECSAALKSMSCGKALISLLYKKDDPELLKNWRPISLLNVDYKIITKVLVNRMKSLMSTVIDPDQWCAVPGRSSEDNATLLRDICDYLEMYSQTACAFIFIDQEKAFDYVDWKFLDRILETMNFGPQFRSFITCIYADIQSAILSNGYVSEFFNVQRGVRQGCPLSPLLFVLVAEVFGQAICKCSEIQGLRLPGGKEVKISQYADDENSVPCSCHTCHIL